MRVFQRIIAATVLTAFAILLVGCSSMNIPSWDPSDLLDFLDTLDFRNVTNDADLKRLADEARALLRGVNMKDLKSTGDLRQRVREGMQQIATQLDSMLVSRGRKIRFDED